MKAISRQLTIVGLMGITCAALGACSSAGPTSGPKYMPRADVAPENYRPVHHRQDYLDRKAYLAYEHREPCQNYRRLPRHSLDLDLCGPADEIVKETVEVTEQALLPIINSYTVYFDFDSAAIRPDAREALDTIENEIDSYNPEQVTVTGYADAAGDTAYNRDLSRRRSAAVTRALADRGIETRKVSAQARGEQNLAVPTPDGVRLQENRRVVVDFRRE